MPLFSIRPQVPDKVPPLARLGNGLEQLRITEEQLGFPLPPFLHMLYAEVANGGPRLGSYFGLFGCFGGYPFNSSDWAELPRLVDRLVSRSGWRPHPCIFDALMRHPGYKVQCEDCPDGFIGISDEAFSTSLALDTKTERLYLVGPGDDMPAEDPTQPSLLFITLTWVAASLEEWLEHWLAGALYTEAYPKSTGYLTPDMVSAHCETDSQLVWRGIYLPQPHYEDSPEYEGCWDICRSETVGRE